MTTSRKTTLALATVTLFSGVLVDCQIPGARSQLANKDQASIIERSKQGDAQAQCELASLYYLGKGLPQNYSEAARWYLKSAEHGYAKAQNDLGVMFYQGHGVQKDYGEAAQWYRMAAGADYAGAQFNLGWMYQSGRGVAHDDTEAFRWYSKAAAQGNASAEYALGNLYRAGQGVHRDYDLAARWYWKAAKDGNRAALYGLMGLFGSELQASLTARWTTPLVIVLGLLVLIVPKRQWAHSSWLLSALMSAMFATVMVRELTATRWPGFIRILLIALSGGASALYAFILFRELRARPGNART